MPALLPPCPASALYLAFDDEGGAFNGMQHSGALMVVRNLGPADCTIPAYPRLTFLDAARQPVGVASGKTVPAETVAIAAGAEVTASLYWVSGDAYGAGNCVTTKSASFKVGSDTLEAMLAARLCGAAGSAPGYRQPALRPDPVLHARPGQAKNTVGR